MGPELKLEAVRLIRDRGVSYSQASQDLKVHTSQLRDWVKKLSDDPPYAFPGHGQMKPEQLEIARLKRELTKLKAERDILKKASGLLREGTDVKFSFIAKHRGIWTGCAGRSVSRVAARLTISDTALNVAIKRYFDAGLSFRKLSQDGGLVTRL